MTCHETYRLVEVPRCDAGAGAAVDVDGGDCFFDGPF